MCILCFVRPGGSSRIPVALLAVAFGPEVFRPMPARPVAMAMVQMVVNQRAHYAAFLLINWKPPQRLLAYCALGKRGS